MNHNHFFLKPFDRNLRETTKDDDVCPTKGRTKMEKSNKHKSNEEKIIEEDWSDFIPNLHDQQGFSRHETVREYVLFGGTKISIECVDALTPLDMIALSWGSGNTNKEHNSDDACHVTNETGYDSTGHRVWLGAELFIKSIGTLQDYFQPDLKILELGTGSGLSGIAIVKILNSPSMVVLTDSSPSALDLCRTNCIKNGVHVVESSSNDSNDGILCVSVKELRWGNQLLADSNGHDYYVFDTVVATDVLYDFQMWIPLLQTARTSLRDSGIFILSHVPRAAIPEEYDCKDKTTVSTIRIEDLILDEASKHGFELVSELKPSTLIVDPDDTELCEEMEGAGATIFIFRKISNED